MRIPRLPLTREHGSWAVMAVPLLIGTAAGESFGWQHVILIVAAIAAFLSYVPAQIMWGQTHGRRDRLEVEAAATFWISILPAVALVAAGWLVLEGFVDVVGWGAAALALFAVHGWLTARQGKSVWGDLVASVGLSVGAPAALMLDGASDWRHAFVLWALVSLFFGSSVMYVHMKIRAVAAKLSEPSWAIRLRFGWVTLAYHVAVIMLVAAIVAGGRPGLLALIAYVPMAIHAVVGTIRLAGPVKFKRLGFLLLGHAILFAVLLATAWRSEA
jgi:hypothetical protein